MTKAITYAVIIFVTLGASTYTAIMAGNDTAGDTISAVLRTVSRDWWIVAWLWGLLAGHWFLGHGQALTSPYFDSVLVIWLTWILFVLNLGHFFEGWTALPTWAYALLLALGTATGHFLWSQGGAHPLQ